MSFPTTSAPPSGFKAELAEADDLQHRVEWHPWLARAMEQGCLQAQANVLLAEAQP